MARKTIVSARQLKARVQIILRATAQDVATNSETVRLMDMIERMKDEGGLIEFYLEALKSKLRAEEGREVNQAEVVRQAVQAALAAVAQPFSESVYQRPVDLPQGEREIGQPMHQPHQTAFVPAAPAIPPTPAPTVALPPVQASVPTEVERASPVQPFLPTAVLADTARAEHIPSSIPEDGRAPNEIIASLMQEIAGSRDNGGADAVHAPPRRRMGGNGLSAMG